MENDDDTRSVTATGTTNSVSRGATEQRDTDESFRAIFDNQHVVMLLIDPETGRIEDASPAACAFYGYSRDDLRKKRIGDINMLTSEQVVERLQLAKSRQQKYFDFQHRLASGEIRDVEVCTGPIAMDGRTLLFSVINDVTDRKRAEAALLESEERYRNLFQNAPIGIFQSTPQGTVLNVNPTFAQIYGYESPQEIIDSVKDVAAQLYVEPEKRRQITGKVLHNDRLLNFENEFRKKDGTVFTGNLHLQVVRNIDGSASHLEGFVEDITERKKAEEDLRESEEKFSKVFRNSPDAITLTDLTNNTLVDVNESYTRISGYSREESIGRTTVELGLNPDDRNKFITALKEQGRVLNFEAPFKTKSGKVIICSISGDLIELGGKPHLLGVVRDRTERKRAEELLKQAERRYRRLFEYAPLMSVITRNEQGVPFIGDCNESFLRSVGYSREEVVGQPLANFYSRTSSVDLLEGGGYSRALEGEFFMGERQLVKRDGSLIPTLLYTAPEVALSGEVIGTCAMFVGITEQKRAEEALLRSEAQLSNALTMGHLGHWEYDVTKDLFTFNDHFYKIFRTTVEQVGGYTMSAEEYARRFVHPDDIPIVADEIRKALETTDPLFSAQLEHRIFYADGDIGYITVRHFVVKDELGRTVATYGVNQDITDRKKAEEALRSEREQLLSIFESINEVILVIDPTTYEILYANKFTEDLYGKKLKGEICYEKLNSLDSSCGHCAIDSIMELQGKPHQWEYHNRVLNKDFLATDRMIRWSDGRDVKFQIAVDITERKLAEHEKENLRSQLLQAQKMEAVGTLAGGIAHDFNNLLQVASGYSELLLQHKDKDDAEYADLLKIFQAAKNGAELVHSLLTFSRKVEPRPIVLNLNTQIVQVDKLLRRTIPKMIAIRLDLSSDLAEINADPTQMEQILMNLAINASDAMPNGGSLTVSTRTATIDEEYCRYHAGATPGEYVVLAVTDTGHGMDKETVEHIFEPFYTTKEIGRGTGLGLAMVYGIVTQHGGHIVCDSEVGRGTTFNIYLPAVPAAAEPAVESSGEMPAFGTETVLLVDDEDLIRELGGRILQRSGYTVLTAANGEEALRVYVRQKEHIALVILDLMMPAMGGKDCLKELLRINPQAKVLIASGYSADASTREILALGAKGFVAKPFKFKGLLQQVRRALDRN